MISYKRSTGFNLIEMLMTLTILGLLASALVPLAETTRRRRDERELKEGLTQLRQAIDAWKRAYDKGEIPNDPQQSGYPPTLKALVEGVQINPNQPRRRFLRAIPINPLLPLSMPREKMWGLRSYASPYTSPKAGSDVYDVYCECTGTALNGVPYRDW